MSHLIFIADDDADDDDDVNAISHSAHTLYMYTKYDEFHFVHINLQRISGAFFSLSLSHCVHAAKKKNDRQRGREIGHVCNLGDGCSDWEIQSLKAIYKFYRWSSVVKQTVFLHLSMNDSADNDSNLLATITIYSFHFTD